MDKFSKMSLRLSAQSHFDNVPKQWDALYSHENKFRYMVNRLLRGALYKRYQLTFEYCGDLSGAKVLDIGCGTGRYSVECAKRGASEVIGIDFAPAMIDFCKNISKEMNVADRCQFIDGDFLSYPFEGEFDVVLAIGLFDYAKEAEAMFRKIARLNPRKFLASFPKFTPIWGIQRLIRYYLVKKCAIYNYTAEGLEQLYSRCGFADHKIIPCGRGFFGVAGTR